jgi:hypothetical protein
LSYRWLLIPSSLLSSQLHGLELSTVGGGV